ncbi:hypothetical protein L915_10380 [Phytophthora nicotianae]|uniref:Uncharacterized protein n=1 Tax=Phytophthora nicotianae TaxID=4792 RepID=W2IXL6_PHYNI|nr:hypothetical protein L915_10380 [Phytophthora nicotianae]ETL38113.1 hypothetical protein L916_10280 [Phytophthora nicotianae]
MIMLHVIYCCVKLLPSSGTSTRCTSSAALHPLLA